MRACFLIVVVASVRVLAASIDSTPALLTAIKDATENTVIELAPGTFELQAPLDLKPGMTIKGAGIDKTILLGAADWKPSTKSLPDPEMKTAGLDTGAYLIRLPAKGANVTLSDMTLKGPQLHGAIFGVDNKNLELHHLKIADFLWSGIRTFSMQGAKIHDCQFIDAGGRWEKGQPGLKGGITGGAIFAIWMADCEIAHNRFTRTQEGKADEFYGIKIRQGKRSHIHHNTIDVNFSIEMAHENDEDVEIDHNVCSGAISIPKYAGGAIPKSGVTFHIHHNYFRDSYSIEFVRNGIEIDHNLFDFETAKDHGNLISGFGQAAAKGPASFHDNLVSNPGRGVIWINEPYDNLDIRNNHIIARTTATPRKDGLFGFNRQSDFKTISIRDNIIQCEGDPRPLLRNKESYGAKIENNQLTGISDTDQFQNPKADRKPGPDGDLKFSCGVHDESTVENWKFANPPK